MEKMQHKHQNPLGYEPVGKLLLKFALPSVVAMLVNAIYNIVDQIFIGQGVGYLGNAATTIAFPVVTVILAASTLLGAGGSAYAAIKLGEHDEEQAVHTVGNVFVLSVLAGIVLAIVGLLFLDPLIRLFGARENTMEYARQYTSIILLAAPFNVLGVSMSNLARTDGNPMLSMYSILIGAVLNVFLDPLFIFVFHWGVAGAAIATGLSQVISAVVLVYYFIRRSHMRLTRRSMKLNAGICRRMSILGISSCALQLASTLLNIILNNVLVYYGNQSNVGGDIALSAMGIVMKISMIIIAICIGIGVGSQPILGFNRGAEQPERIRKAYILALIMSTSVTCFGWLLCETIPDTILLLFGKENAVFTDFAVKSMRIFLGGMFAAGMQIVTTNYFQATGQPLKANIMSMLRQVLLLIPLLLILPQFIGLDGVLYAGVLADLLTGCIVAVFVVIELKKLNRWVRQVRQKV
ncbi:MATE family efflux transporter [Ructibacterium gallinarum]|uniref:Multidrug export protein MepA n=1 Tax=Ructibacterium gallinarum TaxID=2779355 RepID=A0A9D5M4J3_9FIRM|nr:MATE family efflux transporter [Ructibacterium gallinarum]MBE5040475.1 MATE family efflux transporter [Ructibacterium gallinarum]